MLHCNLLTVSRLKLFQIPLLFQIDHHRDMDNNMFHYLRHIPCPLFQFHHETLTFSVQKHVCNTGNHYRYILQNRDCNTNNSENTIYSFYHFLKRPYRPESVTKVTLFNTAVCWYITVMCGSAKRVRNYYYGKSSGSAYDSSSILMHSNDWKKDNPNRRF